MIHPTAVATSPMQSSFQGALERFEMPYSRFGSIPATENPIITTEDVTAYAEAVAAFIQAPGAFRDGSAGAIKKLAESHS